MRPVEGRQVEVYMLRGTTQNRLNFTVEMHNESKSNIFFKSTVNNYYFNSTKTPRENAKISFYRAESRKRERTPDGRQMKTVIAIYQ